MRQVQNKSGNRNTGKQSKVEITKLMRTLTVVSAAIVNVIPLEPLNDEVVRAILCVPCTFIGGVCAFLYYKLDKEQKNLVYKPSFLRLYTILMYPYLSFLTVLIINIAHIISIAY